MFFFKAEGKQKTKKFENVIVGSSKDNQHFAA